MMKNPTRLLFTGFRSMRRLSTAAETEAKKGRLHQKLAAVHATGETVTKTLNEYIMEGKTVSKIDLIRCIRDRRKYGKFQHALEIMEWMEKRKMNFSFADYAVRLDLIAKTKGLAAAEDYLNGLPESAKNQSTYGALLNCYCNQIMSDKALDIFKKMDEMRVLSKPLPFNNLMNLHMKMNQPEKVIALVQQMKEKNISPDAFTYILWMQSCASLNDLEGVERVIDEMKRNDRGKINWSTYTNLATIYLNAGLSEKAESALTEAEAIIGPRDRMAYHFLISLYAGTSNLNEVNRVWESLKGKFSVTTNWSYLVMIQALARLKDIEGLTKCFKEWESSCVMYDIRLPNVAIKVYLEQNLKEEAAQVFDDALKRCTGPFFNAREMFMVFYLRNDQLDLALNHLKAVFYEIKEDNKWQPREGTLRAFFDYFVREKDIEGAEKFCKILKHTDLLDTNAYIHLLKIYMAAGSAAPDMRRRLEEEGVEINDELDNLLNRV